jgi:hypothetical protein
MACSTLDERWSLQTLVIGATLAGSMGAAWMIQKAILGLLVKAIASNGGN